MKPFRMLARIHRMRPGMQPMDAVDRILEAEAEILSQLGGVRHPKLAPFLRGELSETLTQGNHTLSLPEGSGGILSIDLDGKVITLLDLDRVNAAASNWLYTRSATRVGNQVTFHNMDRYFGPKLAKNEAASAVAHVVYEQSFRPFRYEDGFRAHVVPVRKHRTLLKSLSIVQVDFPEMALYVDHEFDGGSLRMVIQADKAMDYTIYENRQRTTNGKTVQEFTIQNDGIVESVNAVRWKIPTQFDGADSVPCVATRMMLPPDLHNAVLNWIQYKLQNDTSAKEDFLRSIEAFRQ